MLLLLPASPLRISSEARTRLLPHELSLRAQTHTHKHTHDVAVTSVRRQSKHARAHASGMQSTPHARCAKTAQFTGA